MPTYVSHCGVADEGRTSQSHPRREGCGRSVEHSGHAVWYPGEHDAVIYHPECCAVSVPRLAFDAAS